MPIEVTLPRIDVDSTTGRIARWLAKDGAAVAKGEPLFEMESEKAAVEVEAPAAGTVRDITLSEGESAPIGSVVARIFVNSEPYAAATRDNGGTPAAPVAIDPAAATSAASPAATARMPETSRQAAMAEPAGKPSRPRATPLARRLARQHGIALEQLKGSGPNGRIQQRDILQAEGADKRPPRAGAATLNVAWLKPGNGPPLVLIHGFGSELGSWRPLIADDSMSGPILAIDLPGHGLSPLGTEISFAHLVELAQAALVRLGIEHADLAGHSLGGAVAAALAESTHLNARSLTMIAPAGLGPDINGAFIDGMNRATTEEGLTAWLKLAVANAERLNPAFVKAILARRREMDTQSAQQRLAAALFAESTQNFSIRSTLDRLSIPVKVIFGLEDRIIPPHHARGLPGTVAVHLFRAVGHLPHIEARGGVLQLLREIVRRNASPQP